MKLLRCVAITLLCIALAFIAMVLTAMAFARGWGAGFGLLGLIWCTYLVFKLLPWEAAANVWLAAFVGYATGLLWQADRFVTDTQTEIVSRLPSTWVGAVGLAVYLIFVALLPGLANAVASRLKKATGGLRGLATPVAWNKRRQ